MGTAAWHREIKQKTKAQTCRVTCDQEEFLVVETKTKQGPATRRKLKSGRRAPGSVGQTGGAPLAIHNA
jgi:hypothetical protein